MLDRRPIACVLVLAAATAAAYGWTLGGYFVGDDFGYVSHFLHFPLSRWPALFVQDWSDGIWNEQTNELRPFSALAFILDARVWGTNPAGYHLTNLLLHFACAVLVMLIAFEALGRIWWRGLAAGVLFAVHPVQARAVAWITGRVDLLSALGFFLAFYALMRFRREDRLRWLPVTWAAFAFGIFAKESSLVFPVVAASYDLFLAPKRRSMRAALLPYLGWAVLLGVYFFCRSNGMTAVVPVTLDSIDWLSALTRGMSRVIPYTAAMVFSSEFLYGSAVEVEPYVGWLTVLALAAIAVASVWAVRRPQRDSPAIRAALMFGLTWTVLTTAPLIVTYLSFRHLYTASAGFVIGVVSVLTHLQLRRPVLGAAYATLLLALATQLLADQRLWQEAFANSRQLRRTVARVAEHAAPGDVLLLDAPARRNNIWVWAWASPFALRPPFQQQDLTRQLIVIERPEVYRDPDAWPRDTTSERLKKLPKGAWLVWSDPDRDVMSRPLSAEEIEPFLDRSTLSDPDTFTELLEEAAEGPPE